MTFAATILMRASMAISRVMLWLKSLTAWSMAMIKKRFNIPTPMDRAQG